MHFVLDTVHAGRLQERWQDFGHTTELRLVSCLDRNWAERRKDVVLHVRQNYPDAKATVLLPRRTYSAVVGRLLHDRTADNTARLVSRIPGASAQVVAYDIGSRIARAQAARAKDMNRRGRAMESLDKTQATTPAR